jgi:hypothetical protein
MLSKGRGAQTLSAAGKQARVIITQACTLLLTVSFVVFAGMSIKLFSYFTCVTLEDGRRYLKADMRIDCNSAPYRAFIPYVVLGILVYPIGITVAYAGLLYKFRHRIERPDLPVALALKARQRDRQLKLIDFLWAPYEPRAWW